MENWYKVKINNNERVDFMKILGSLLVLGLLIMLFASILKFFDIDMWAVLVAEIEIDINILVTGIALSIVAYIVFSHSEDPYLRSLENMSYIACLLFIITSFTSLAAIDFVLFIVGVFWMVLGIRYVIKLYRTAGIEE